MEWEGDKSDGTIRHFHTKTDIVAANCWYVEDFHRSFKLNRSKHIRGTLKTVCSSVSCLSANSLKRWTSSQESMMQFTPFFLAVWLHVGYMFSLCETTSPTIFETINPNPGHRSTKLRLKSTCVGKDGSPKVWKSSSHRKSTNKTSTTNLMRKELSRILTQTCRSNFSETKICYLCSSAYRLTRCRKTMEDAECVRFLLVWLYKETVMIHSHGCHGRQVRFWAKAQLTQVWQLTDNQDCGGEANAKIILNISTVSMTWQ